MEKNFMYNEAIAHPLRYHVKCLVEALEDEVPISLFDIKIDEFEGSLYCPCCGGQYSEKSLLNETNEITKGRRK